MTTPLTHPAYSTTYRDRTFAIAKSRSANDRAVIENPLSHLTDAELELDVRYFSETFLPSVKYQELLRAARVGKDIRMYDEAARQPAGYDERNRLSVILTEEEKAALRNEKDVAFSEKGMFAVIATVSLAAFLQGFVQSSVNGASLYIGEWGLSQSNDSLHDITPDDWKLGAANSSPFLFAALIGCPLSLPINYWFGRRGGISVAAILILGSSIGAIFVTSWTQMFGVRVVNGIGMGIKAVSTPILASETAVGFWRGSAILAWQLWVAFGIMMSFAFNLIFTRAASPITTYRLIQGSPLVPAFALMIMALFVCPESPRYHLLKGPNYSVEKAYMALKRVRNTKLQALRDLYLVCKSIEQENMDFGDLDPHAMMSPGFFWVIRDFARQFAQLFQRRRLYNAVLSTSTVNLAQQLCGGIVFQKAGGAHGTITNTMAYSLGFGAINFLFALPAVKSIDTLGRRRWLLLTIPFMAAFMLGAGLSDYVKDDTTRNGVTACFLFLFAMAYSPGLGPIPFTLASESFPLTHREAGTAWAISINLFFAGLLAVFFPGINSVLGQKGSMGIFAGLNVVAFVMVFLFVEETKQRSLEELDHIFAVSKRDFMRFKLTRYLPWVVGKYVFRMERDEPRLYKDLVWGTRAVDLKPRGGEALEEDRVELQPRRPNVYQPPMYSDTTRPDIAEMEEIYPPGVAVPCAKQ
ncbi:sugar transporter [Metarhizium album ARSEF 1941]|uniref:Sugar transporter n=1 Tax=Metarhizium album (strain ARSEF 1941) TaxID=1081103 RepID=A0A0B2X6B6_METAS|nr:sugar transporter [Metarhizium album ARSEF 1941]KHO01020.1 sugar transporter [Metarhizium album ARSEF 1941]